MEINNHTGPIEDNLLACEKGEVYILISTQVTPTEYDGGSSGRDDTYFTRYCMIRRTE